MGNKVTISSQPKDNFKDIDIINILNTSIENIRSGGNNINNSILVSLSIIKKILLKGFYNYFIVKIINNKTMFS